MEFILIIMSSLAVWRVTYMIREETGPFEIFSRLQAWFWRDPVRLGGLKDGLRCFNCTSVWFSSIPALFFYHDDVGKMLVAWFAIASLAMFINRFYDKIE